MNELVKITLPAHKQLIKLSKLSNNKSIFYSVKGGGCNRFDFKTKMANHSYQYNLTPMQDEPSYLMHSVDMESYKLYICEYSFKHLANSTIHWEKNVMNERFDFENPNAEYVYKCKNSFISKHKV